IPEIKENYSGKADGRIEEILRFIESNYVDSLDQKIISIDAVRHILRQLDPHSDYIGEDELTDHNEKMEGAYRGIGIETLKLKDTFYVTKVIEHGPAYKAGLKLGDAIISVDNQLVSGNQKSFSSVRDLLKAEDKNKLELSVIPFGEKSKETRDVEISSINLSSAELSYMPDESTVYVKLERFSDNTYEQFIESLDYYMKDNDNLNLILDLRNNPGGYLPEAIKILSQLFKEKDKLLTYTEGMNRKKAEYRTTGKNFYSINKLAVLINEYSASGSEILAGAVQDWDRGVVIGRESFGKGLVQEIFPLRNGGALRLTVAKYYTPSGRLIQKSYRSINKDFEADSVDYQTRLLNRKVLSGNGIVPDYIIDETEDLKCRNYLSYLDFFILNKMLETASLQVATDEITRQEYARFLENNFELETSYFEDSCPVSKFQRILESRYVRLISGEKEYIKKLNEGDPFIQKALLFIQDQKTTLAYLSEKN
ncbi:MAG: PDZ domain-containing protein, partial [Bacteroidia bacterium]|nr:PDZ domain-containing protein [Bacteroidia bacterium]